MRIIIIHYNSDFRYLASVCKQQLQGKVSESPLVSRYITGEGTLHCVSAAVISCGVTRGEVWLPECGRGVSPRLRGRGEILRSLVRCLNGKSRSVKLTLNFGTLALP